MTTAEIINQLKSVNYIANSSIACAVRGTINYHMPLPSYRGRHRHLENVPGKGSRQDDRCRAHSRANLRIGTILRKD